jgi:hypothetical protein
MNLHEADLFLRRTWTKTKYEAINRRGLQFDITANDLMTLLVNQNGKCALTGWDLEFTRGGEFGSGTNPLGCSIDRKDNQTGYIASNIQLVCWKANKIKNDLSDSEFKELCKAVANHA